MWTDDLDADDAASQLSELSDNDLWEITQAAIYDAALMNRFPQHSNKYHDRSDVVYVECAKRARGIYQKAYNSVVRAQGHYDMVNDIDPEGA